MSVWGGAYLATCPYLLSDLKCQAGRFERLSRAVKEDLQSDSSDRTLAARLRCERPRPFGIAVVVGVLRSAARLVAHVRPIRM